MKVLVTGGAGFIGSNLVEAMNFRHPTWQVTVLDNFVTGSLSNLEGLACGLVEGSILDDEILGALVAEADSIVHLAALGSVPRSISDPVPTFEANVVGTKNLLELIRPNPSKRIIFASSSSVYGASPRFPRREGHALSPLSPYAASKAACEAMLLGYSQAFEIPTSIFRFFNVYGPRQSPQGPYAAVIPRFMKNLHSLKPLDIYGDGMQKRDFTFVSTVVDTIISQLARPVDTLHPVNLASGRQTSIIQLARTLGKIMNRNPELNFLPKRSGDVLDSQADTTSLDNLFPDVRNVGLIEGLSATVDWYERQ